MQAPTPSSLLIALAGLLLVGCCIGSASFLHNANAERTKLERGLSLTISGRNLLVSRAEQPPRIITVPPVPAVHLEINLASSGWPAAMRKMTTVCNPSLFLRKTLVPGSLRTTVMTAVAPLNAREDRYGPDNLTGSEFQSALNEQYLKVLGLHKETGKSQAIQYTAKARRLDTLTLNKEGEIKLELGIPTDLAPIAPKIPEQEFALANILAEPDDMRLTEADVFPITVAGSSKHEHQGRGCLHEVCQKLRTGKPLRIVFYGDSITCGGSVENPELSFCNLFTRELKKRYPSSEITAINIGLGGTSTNTRLPRFREEVLSERPDLLVVEFVNNFALSKEEIKRDFDTMLTQAKAHGIDVILCTPHLFAPNYFPKSYGMKTWEMVAKHPYVEQIRSLAKQYHTGLADVAARWENLQSDGLAPELLLTDKLLHINERGHEIYAEELLKCVKTELDASFPLLLSRLVPLSW